MLGANKLSGVVARNLSVLHDPEEGHVRQTEWLQETLRMRFKEAYEGWQARRLTQEEVARLLGVCARTFRRYQVRRGGFTGLGRPTTEPGLVPTSARG